MGVLLAGRPENTHKGKTAVCQADLNVLYCCTEKTRVSLSKAYGKCQVVYMEESHDSHAKLDEYFSGGPDRFYFTEARSHSICYLQGLYRPWKVPELKH